MKKILPAILCIAFCISSQAQAPAPNYTFFNSGDSVYIEPGGLLYIGDDQNTGDNGDLVVRGKLGLDQKDEGIYNDGVIAVSGNIYSGGTVNSQDYGNPKFTTANFPTGYKERLVSLVGEVNDQYIKGFLDQPENSFYNFGIDKIWDINNSPKVIMESNIRVNGSMFWDPKSAVTNTFDYNSSTVMSSSYPSNLEGEGAIQTFSGSSDYELYIANAHPHSLMGYSNMVGGAKTNQNTIINRGAQGVGIGGLARAVNAAYVDSQYVFPIGTNAASYNPVALNFSQLPAGDKKVRGLFADGNVGSVDYNYYGTLTCANQPQWFIFDEFTGNGYWSFDAEDNSNSYKYFLVAYPSGYSPGSDFNNRRILKYSSSIDDVPNDNQWTSQVDADYSPAQLDDILSNHTTFNSVSACFPNTNFGVPGGPYSGFSHFQMGGNSSNGLPVELLTLKAFPVNNEYITVAWTTATEINNERFDVLRSEDGINFVKIGDVAGSGTTTDIRNYTFNDKNVLPNITYYYRLEQHDFDGTSELSNIVSAAITGSSNVVISEFIPNPAHDASKLLITSPTDIKLDVTMYNAIGQEIQSSSIELAAGVQTPFGVQGHVLAAGNYIVTLRNESFFVSRRLVITAH